MQAGPWKLLGACPAVLKAEPRSTGKSALPWDLEFLKSSLDTLRDDSMDRKSDLGDGPASGKAVGSREAE